MLLHIRRPHSRVHRAATWVLFVQCYVLKADEYPLKSRASVQVDKQQSWIRVLWPWVPSQLMRQLKHVQLVCSLPRTC